MELLFRQFDFNLAYAQELVKDLTEEQMTNSPFPGFENHPAWTIGHLVSGCALMLEDLGDGYQMPDGWSELFLRNGPGDPRLPAKDVQLYPVKSELIDQLRIQHEKVKQRMKKLTHEEMTQSLKWRFGKYFPTMIDYLTYMITNHEAGHLSQLGAWRRAMGLESALAKI